MLFLLTESPQKLELENINGTLITIFYVNPSFSQLQRFPFIKNTKNPFFSK